MSAVTRALGRAEGEFDAVHDALEALIRVAGSGGDIRNPKALQAYNGALTALVAAQALMLETLRLLVSETAGV